MKLLHVLCVSYSQELTLDSPDIVNAPGGKNMDLRFTLAPPSTAVPPPPVAAPAPPSA